MEYKEFERRVKDLGLFMKRDEYGRVNVFATPELTMLVAMICDDEPYAISICRNGTILSPMKREKLFDLVVEYARTPVEQRIEVKKYNVVSCRHKYGTPGNMTEDAYFYYRGDDGCLLVTNGMTNDDEDQQWTMQQIKEYGLEDCEKIEVKE